MLKVILSSLAPCVPDGVTVVQLCEGNGAAVRWRNSFVATSYQLTATGRDRHVATCNTLVNNCTLANLHCGQPYNLSITASGDNCTSKPSTSSFTTGRNMIIHFLLTINFLFFLYLKNYIWQEFLSVVPLSALWAVWSRCGNKMREQHCPHVVDCQWECHEVLRPGPVYRWKSALLLQQCLFLHLWRPEMWRHSQFLRFSF